MTNAQIVALGVRLFSIWVVLYLFGHTPGLWTFIEHGKSGSGAGFVVTVSAVLVFAAVGLWFFPLAVARKLLPKATLDQPTPLPVEDVQRAGFCLLGLWVLTESVPDLIWERADYSACCGGRALGEPPSLLAARWRPTAGKNRRPRLTANYKDYKDFPIAARAVVMT